MDLESKTNDQLMAEIEELLAVRAEDVDVAAIRARLDVLDARDSVLADYDVDAAWQRFLRRLESGR